MRGGEVLMTDGPFDEPKEVVAGWPAGGVPPAPGAWLAMTARDKAIDRLRRASVGAAKLREPAVLHETAEPPASHEGAVEDDRSG
ncbi:hypothetical protein WBK31_10305 [Nonomuraea sp. N2-4H]|uniref:hypothetical protein n=1 Tax=Nonomuraea sp. N2-4H TaxID=3128898 RepID=UPI003255230C